MAIYHFSAKIIKRSDGRSAVKAAAYRHATKMFDERIGEYHNYSFKRNVSHSEIMVPKDSPAWLMNLESSSEIDYDKTNIASQQLWNTVELNEKRKDAQLSREFEFSLPIELGKTQNLYLARDFISKEFVSRGMVADFSVHWEPGNPHVHVMLTMREITNSGFGLKVRSDCKSQSFSTDWNSKAFLNEMRGKWADHANYHLRKNGIDMKIDHRSFIDQGIDLAPGIHEGVGAKKMRQNGMNLERISINSDIKTQNYAHVKNNPSIITDKLSKAKERFNTTELVNEVNRYVPESFQLDLDSFFKPESLTENENSKATSDDLIEIMSQKNAVFSDLDASKVANENTQSQQEFLTVLNELKSNKSIIHLGLGEDGREQYTTRERFKQESNMLDQASALSSLKSHRVRQSIVTDKASNYNLNNSQYKALDHIVNGADITLVIGQAGTGKTYMMQVAKEIWEDSGFKVQGVALSGIAAEGLQEAGINSNTIHSFKYSLDKGHIKLSEKDVIVMDEAGMTDSDDMAAIVKAVSDSGAKLSIIGDLEQTQSLGAGSGLKSLMGAIPFVEMDEILRQKKEGDRLATANLASAKTDMALDYYNESGKVSLLETKDECQKVLIESWASTLSETNLKDRIILAHQNANVNDLNTLAREHIAKNGWIKESQLVKANSGQLMIGVNERILFLKNDKNVGVKNGSFGTVLSIKGGKLSVQLDSGKKVNFTTANYHQFTHGYAATVHKTQGVTKDDVFVHVDGFGWDRHLTYVALSRHRNGLNVFGSKDIHASFDELKTSLSRYGIKDSIIDYPLGFSLRRGFDVDATVNKAAYVVSLKEKVVDSWLYLTNYNAYLDRVISREAKIAKLSTHREKARKVARYADFSRYMRNEYDRLKSGLNEDIPLWKHPKYREFQEKQVSLDALGSQIWSDKDILGSAIDRNRIKQKTLEKGAKSHQFLVDSTKILTAMKNGDKNCPIHLLKAAYALQTESKASYSMLNYALHDSGIEMKDVNTFIREGARRYAYFKATPANKTIMSCLEKYENLRIQSGMTWHKSNRRSESVHPGQSKIGQSKIELSKSNHINVLRNELAYHLKENLTEARNYANLYHLDEEKLQTYAKKHEKVLFVKKYEQEKRPVHRAYMAKFITDNIKEYYPAIKHLRLNSKTLQHDARHHEYLTTLGKLNADERRAYSMLAEYKNKRFDAGFAWSEQCKNIDSVKHKGKFLKEKAEHLFTQRNKLAQDLDAYVYQNKLTQFYSKFDIDQKVISKFSTDYHAENIVKSYLQESSIKKRDYLAAELLNERSAYKYIHRYNLKFPDLYRQKQANLRRQTLLSLSASERKIWRSVDEYKQSIRSSKIAWAKYFEAQKSNMVIPGQIEFCQALTKTRNEKAYDIALNAKKYAPYLASENIKGSEIEKHAISYSQSLAKAQGIKAKPQKQTEMISTIRSAKKEIKRFDYDLISKSLCANTEQVYESIFGKPKSKSSREMRYPGGLVVTLKGSHRGSWHDFSGSGSRSGGGPIQAIQLQYGCDFKAALEQGASIAGLGASLSTDINLKPIRQVPEKKINTVQESQALQKRIQAAKYYFDSAKPIAGTLGERYLEQHRGIDKISPHVRFHPRIKDPSSGVYYPGIVVAARNVSGDITATQTILLDPATANKANIEVVKRTRGVVSGSAVLLQEGTGKVYLAEGPETGLSIAEANPNASVYITLGNFKNAEHVGWIAQKHQTSDIIIAADNDGASSRINKTVDDVAQTLHAKYNIRCFKATPTIPGKAKCDFNDVIKKLGVTGIKSQLDSAKLIPIKEIKQYRSTEEIKKSLNTDVPELFEGKHKPKEHNNDQKIEFSMKEIEMLLRNPEWDNLKNSTGKLLTSSSKILLNARAQILENITDEPKVRRLMKPITSILEKISNSKVQSPEFKKLAPNLSSQIEKNLKTLSLTYNKDGIERGRER